MAGAVLDTLRHSLAFFPFRRPELTDLVPVVWRRIDALIEAVAGVEALLPDEAADQSGSPAA